MSCKAIISIALLWVLLANVDIGSTISLIRRVNFQSFAIVIAVLTLCNCASAYRWYLVLIELKQHFRLGTTVRLVFIGVFFNQVLPSSIGGDAIRTYYLSKHEVSLTTATTSVLIDRLSGLIGMSLLTAFGILVLLLFDASIELLMISVLLSSGGLIGTFLILNIHKFPQYSWIPSFIEHARTFSRASKSLLFSRAGVRVTGCSVIAQLLTIFSFIVIGHTLDIALSPAIWFAIVPQMLMATILPISFAGWGVREGVLVFALAYYSVGTEEALAASIIFGIAQIIRSLPGGLVWLLRDRKEPPKSPPVNLNVT